MDLSNLYSDLSTTSDSGVGNGTTVDFVLSQYPKNILDPLVTLNGIKRRYTTDYTINLATKTISFVVAPVLGQTINITYKYI
jgi:hypothetical protein